MNENKIPRNWLEKLSDALLREPKDRVQLLELLRDAEQRALLDSDAQAMIEGVLQVSEMQVREVMIPRYQMIVVEAHQSPGEILPIVIDSAHSRFPVIGENKHEVIGILLAKDLLAFCAKNNNGDSKEFKLKDLLRPAMLIPESKRLNVLLREFRSGRNHMAIVVDEYGDVAGLVTIEDVLEQIVGDIEDEYDIDGDEFVIKHSETDYVVKAHIPIEEFNNYFGTRFTHDEFDTIGGLVIHEFGHLPKRGESVTIGDNIFNVLRADNRRINLIQVFKNKTNAN